MERVFHGFGGRFGLLNKTALELAVGRPKQSFDGTEFYDSLDLKAAALVESLIRNHPFEDANKRTAILSAVVMFQRNGRSVVADPDELYSLALAIASGEMSVEELAKWFANESHVLPVTEEEWETMPTYFGGPGRDIFEESLVEEE